MDVRIIGLTACAIVAAAIVARILWFFTNRVPVLAHSENTDALGETASNDPLNPEVIPQGAASFDPLKQIDMRVDYEVGGKHYEHEIHKESVVGLDIMAPDDTPILWADPKDPTRVEAYGPGYWVLALLVVGGVAAAIFEFAA